MKFEDLTGQKFNKLTVLKHIGKARTGQSKWLCQCDCPEKQLHAALGSHLKTGNIKSCGCLARGEARSKASQTHGGTKTPEYNAYWGAKKRCDSKYKKNYPTDDYAARGIEFRFNSFQEFFDELGPRPSPDHSVDRIDNDGHYERGNVRWATRKEQARNRRCDNCSALKAKIAELEALLVNLTNAAG